MFSTLIIWWVVVNSLDFMVTAYGLHQGLGTEINTVPLAIVSVTGLAGLFIWKISWTYVGIWLLSRGHERTMFAFGILCAILSAVVLWNLTQINHGV